MKVANKVKFEVSNLEKNVSLPETFNTILFFKEKQYSVYPMNEWKTQDGPRYVLKINALMNFTI